jgi:sugar phosphate permease
LSSKKEIFPGYIMVLVTAIVSYWGAGIFMYSLGNYVTVLNEAFGWSRAEISLAGSFTGIVMGLQGAISGVAIDKFGPRVINLIGISMLGIGFCLLYFIDSLWMFYTFWLFAGFGYSMGMIPALSAAVAKWFVKKRGVMLSLANMGLCLSGLTMVPLIMWLLTRFGYQSTFVISGVGALVIGLPLAWFFMRSQRPEYYGWLPDGHKLDENTVSSLEATIQAGAEYAASGEEIEFTVRQAIKDKSIWIFALASTLGMMPGPVIMAHSVPYLTDMGIESVLAASITGITVFMRFPTQLLFGWLSDRVSKNRLRYLAMIGFAVNALGMFILTNTTSVGIAWIYGITIGLGNGVFSGVMFPLRGRYWGRKAFASIAGIIAPFMMAASMIGPVFAGWVYDTTGSYTTAFYLITGLTLLGFVFMFFAAPPKPPAKITKVTEFL